MSERIDDLLAPPPRTPDDRDVHAIQWQMKTPQGRAFVWMVLSESGMLRNPLHTDQTIMGFNVGKQDLGRWLFDMIDTYCPEMYPVMVSEAKQKEQKDDN